MMEDRDVLIFLQSLYLNEDFYNEILTLDNLDDIFQMEGEDFSRFEFSNKKNVDKIIEKRNKDYINKMVEGINTYCTQVITIYDENYPIELQLIERPPKVLFVKGLPLDVSGVKIGVVGARKCTAYGSYAVEKFVSELARMKCTIVSGMAQGIDAYAHKIALENDAYSIGVLGTGVDSKFPKSNHRLFDRMYEQGTIISEYPIGASAMPYNFPERNRIISGLSEGVIVVEAKDRSGSLITARLAAEQSKEIWAVPGNINSIYSVGTNKLIRDGAIPLIEIEDITSVIPGLEENSYENFKGELAISEEEKLVLEKIEEGFDSVDSLVEETRLNISKINSIVTLLEMKGFIQDLTGIGLKKN